MARRFTPEARDVAPDVRYHRIDIQEMINRIMIKGKKSTAASLMYDALDLIEERTGKDPVETFGGCVEKRFADDGGSPTPWVAQPPGADGSGTQAQEDSCDALDHFRFTCTTG